MVPISAAAPPRMVIRTTGHRWPGHCPAALLEGPQNAAHEGNDTHQPRLTPNLQIDIMAVDEVVLPVEEIQISDGLPHRVRAQAGAKTGRCCRNSPAA